MTTVDLDRADFALLDELRRTEPVFAETRRGVQAASESYDDGRGTIQTREERSRAWRAVMAGDLLGVALLASSVLWTLSPVIA